MAAVAIAAAVFLVLLAVANIIVVQQHGGSATSRASTPSEDAAVARAVAALHARLTNRCLIDDTPYLLPPLSLSRGGGGVLVWCMQFSPAT